jgi:hypothetical protein
VKAPPSLDNSRLKLGKVKAASNPSLQRTLTKSEKQLAAARDELLKMFAEAARAKKDASDAQKEAEQLRLNLAKSRAQSRFRLRAAATVGTAVLMLGALIKLAYFASHEKPAVPVHVAEKAHILNSITKPVSAPVSSMRPSPQTVFLSARSITPLVKMNPLPRENEFEDAVERLRDAFDSFPGEHQMDIVGEINKRYSAGAMACPLGWTDGEPVLFVGDTKGHTSPSVIGALNQCASAVEKLRTEELAKASPAQPSP